MHSVTQALLHRDFGGLEWSCPPDHLCPPVPNRLNYILWLEDLLASWLPLTAAAADGDPAWRTYRPSAIDVGTGASAIYCVLGE